jgi:hypothetical protein
MHVDTWKQIFNLDFYDQLANWWMHLADNPHMNYGEGFAIDKKTQTAEIFS